MPKRYTPEEAKQIVRRDGIRMFYKAKNKHVRSLIEQAFTQANHIVRGDQHE